MQLEDYFKFLHSPKELAPWDRNHFVRIELSRPNSRRSRPNLPHPELRTSLCHHPILPARKRKDRQIHGFLDRSVANS